ncbi:MAG: PKD domain-containing protein [Crocinitomicaceae bacterium]|nr:PKD domain-containing protein [Crocinitomicaceae bacterium]
MHYFKNISVVFALVLGFTANGQNLVLNPSFESVNTGSLQCSWYTTQGQFNNAINNWTCPTGGSTDIFNTALATSCYCSPFSTHASNPGQQAPRTGNGYVNIVVYGNGGCTPWREYIQGELSSPLVVGTTYEVSFYVSLADKMAVGTNNIGVKFEQGAYNQGSNCPYYTTPDLNYTGPIILDKNNWTQISFCYTPTQSGITHFIIGNFYNDAATTTAPASGVTTGNTIRYYVEDVMIQPVALAGGNPGTNGSTSICPTDPPINLFSFLGGTPDTGGTWTGPSVLSGGYLGTYDPAVNTPGTYTYEVTGSGLCAPATPATATVTVTAGSADATITPAGPFCDNATPVTLSAATGGGTWSGTGITNASTGTFDPIVAGPGTHTITYTITGACTGTDTENIIVNASANATITPAGPFCNTDPAITLSAVDPGGTWSGTGITNTTTGTFNPATAGTGTHTVTYTIGGACGDIQTSSIIVNNAANATITPVGPFCDSDPAVVLTAVDPGGTWSGSGITNTTNGDFDPVTAGVGTHTITYTIAGACGDVQTTDIIVNNTANATVTPAGPFCDSDPAVVLTAVDPGGTWSGTGITNATNGDFDPIAAGPGTHTITYTIAGACGDVQTTDIIVNNTANAAITPVGPFCDSDPVVVLTGADPGGTWSGTGITNTTNGDFDPVTAGVGTHTITYTIAGACGDVQTTDIIVNNTANATVTPAGPFCDSDPAVVLTAVDPGGTWSGTGITNATNGDFDPIAAGPGTHTITYTIAGACGDVQTTDIIVNNTANAAITPVGPFCDSDPVVVLTGADPGGTWSGTGITNTTNGDFDPTTAGVGTHTITYTISGACGDVQTTNIIVNQLMDATISAAGPFCDGDAAVNLNAVDPGGTWSGTGITDPNSGSFDPVTAGVGTHTVTYTIAGSCGSTDTENIVVNAIDDATINPAGPFCLVTNPQTLTAVTPGGTWSGNGVSNATTGEFIPFDAGEGVHTITYTTSGVCPSTSTASIEVLGPLTVTALQDGSICEGDTWDLSAQGNGGDGNITITWTDDQGNNLGTNSNITVTPTQTTIYTATVTDGCSTAPQSDQVTVVVNPLPVIQFVPQNPSGCVPFTANFTNATSPIGTSCTWDFGDGSTSNVCGDVSHTYTTPGCYDVTLTATEGSCTSTQTVTNIVCVSDYAQASFTMSPQEVDIMNPTVEFSNQSTNATSYEWTFGDNTSSFETNPSHNFPDDGADTYEVCLSAINAAGCNDVICNTVTVTEELIFYIPNVITPDGDMFNELFMPIFVSGFDPYDYHFTIFNRWGEIIWESYDPSVGWNGHYGDGGLVEDGVYVWQVDFKSNQSDQRFLRRGHVTVLK